MTLTVAALVNKARPVLDRFVRWYRAQGAARIGPRFGNRAGQTGNRRRGGALDLPTDVAGWLA